ncbi:MAG: PKD domain-containing protein [Ginsengibacter sp.]
MYKLAVLLYLCMSTITLRSQTVSFTYQSTTGSYCNPDTIRFTPTASGSPIGYIWDFGNGRGSHSANPSVIYTNAGTYIVKLLVVYPQGTVQVTNTLIINPITNPAFTVDRLDICQPGDINFSAVGGSNVLTYSWNFGDGGPVISSSNKDISHNYSKFGNFPVVLTINSVAGCVSSSTQTITVQKPIIIGTPSSTQGCIPAAVNFSSSVSLLPNDGISNYAWNYGDGSPVINTLAANTSYVYKTTGKFLPQVAVTTIDGCSNIYEFDSVAFGIPPTNLIAYTNKNVICGSDVAVFVGKATNANYYTWDNDEAIDVVTDTISKYKYKTLGTKKILVTPYFNGCPGTSDSFNIDVIGVISNFEFINNCADKKTFFFTNRSLGNLSSITWDFGDGSPQQTSKNVFHTFIDTGTYVISLTVTDNITGCSDVKTQQVSIADPILINPDQSICRNSNTTFTVLNVYPGISSTYLWYVVGKKPGQGPNNVLNIKADQLGTFDPVNNIVVIKNGSSYCADTIQLNHKIIVKGPVVNFTSKDSICLSTLLDFTNNSKPYIPGETIVSWDWNFGDGSIHDSTFQPTPHEYSNPGIYTVSLTATDINGCTDVFRKKVNISDDAFLYLLPRIDTLCSGQSKTLIAYQNDSIIWSPANLVSCATCDTVTVNPTKTTTFYATSSNAFGCTARDSVLVKVYSPFTATTSASDLYTCLGESVQLNAGPSGYKIMWSPANGLSDPNVYSPVASPTANTVYTATLSDSVGCFTSTVDILVHLKTPPNVNAGPDQFYPFNSTFTISPVYSSNIVSYLWTPSNQLNCTTCSSPSGTITQKETYTITVTSDSGCVAKDDITIYVECKDANLLLPTAFTPNNDNVNDVYYPLTRGISTILNFSIYNRAGQLVYQKKNFPPNNKFYGWDGTTKGSPRSTSVYVYTIDALCDSGENLSKRGSFVLVK